MSQNACRVDSSQTGEVRKELDRQITQYERLGTAKTPGGRQFTVFLIGVRVRLCSFRRAACLALPAWGCRGCRGIGRWGREILAQRERFKPAVER